MMIDKSVIEQNTILLVNVGSHAYGTNLPTSDLDTRGVLVAPKDYYLGLHSLESTKHTNPTPRKLEQYEATEEDTVIYDIRKYIALAQNANPNILEIVFTDDSDVLTQTPTGVRLRAHRHLFLSKKAKYTFSGYAIAQLKKIESHRRWLLNPPAAPPIRTEFGLPERTVIPKDQLAAAQSLIRKQIEAWENTLPTFGVDVTDPAQLIDMRNKLMTTLTEMRLGTEEERQRAAGRTIGLDDNFIELLDREHRYVQKRREWDNYRQWQSERNAARAELERKYGYDTKHGMHLVRLMRMCREILTSGEVLVKRPDAAELLAIRAGAWSYDRLMQWARDQDVEMNALYSKSTLSNTPDYAAINVLCCELIEQHWREATD